MRSVIGWIPRIGICAGRDWRLVIPSGPATGVARQFDEGNHAQVDALIGPRKRRTALSLDAVLVDAPCTSLGTIRRHPEVKWRITADGAISASVLQFDLLEAAVPFVAVGGRLIYSVCTFTKVETDDVVNEFCEEHPEFIKTVEMRLWPHRDAADAHYAAVFVRQ